MQKNIPCVSLVTRYAVIGPNAPKSVLFDPPSGFVSLSISAPSTVLAWLSILIHMMKKH